MSNMQGHSTASDQISGSSGQSNLKSAIMGPAFFAFLGNLIWGFSYPLSRVALRTATPPVLLSFRYIAALLFMLCFVAAKKQKLALRGKSIKMIFAIGILDPIYFYAESYSILYTNATSAGMVVAAIPIFAIIFAAIFLKEYPTPKQVFFSVVSVIGVILITISGSAVGVITPVGAVLLLITCITGAVNAIVRRKSSEQFTVFERTFIAIAFSSVVFTASSLTSLHFDLTSYFSHLKAPSFLISVLILSVFCSVTANMSVNYAVGKMPISRFSVFAAITTVCSTFTGVIFLKEPVTFLTLFGTALVLIGVWQVTVSAAPSENTKNPKKESVK